MKKAVLLVAILVLCIQTVVHAVEVDYIENFENLCLNGTEEDFERIMKKIGVNTPLNSTNSTPLMVAAKNGHTGIIKRLLKMGAKVDLENVHKFTALTYAVQSANSKAAHILLEAGANPNRIDKYGTPILHRILDSRNIMREKDVLYMVKKLIDHGADINCVNSKGETLLHQFVDNEVFIGFVENTTEFYDQIINKLGAKKSLEIKDSKHHTPIWIVRSKIDNRKMSLTGSPEAAVLDLFYKALGKTLIDPND